MFCPNCGTQNDSAATPCKNCGFRLSGVSASKFKGTMMLNSDQTVQEMIEEHKKKRAETASDAGGKARASSPPDALAGSIPPKPTSVVPPPSASPPSSGVTGAPRPVFQPPRAGAPKRRMGGTMLGVAPQVGGVAPPPDFTAAPPPVQVVEPARQEPAGPSGGTERAGELTAAAEPSSSPEPLAVAGTVAMPIMPEAAPVPPAAPMPERPTAGRTQPLVVASAPGEEQLAADADAVRDPAGRAPAMTAPLPQYSGATSDLVLEDPAPPRARRIRPFEIALIVLTCGLYGIVVLLRQRRSPIP